MSIIGLDHVQVAAPAGCEQDARRFYGELLGLAEIEKPLSLRGRGGVWFRTGSQQLHVGVQQGFVAARKAHPGLRVSAGALDGLAARLTAAGVKVVWDDALDGVRRFHTEDPWGNRIELLAATDAVRPRLTVRPVLDGEHPWLASVLQERWGGDLIVARGRVYGIEDLRALLALDGEERVGLLTFNLQGDTAEIVTLDAFREGAGVGGALVDAVAQQARTESARRLVVMTTNDNVHALRFYQRAGFQLAAVRTGAVAEARRIKPSIPQIGHEEIPIRDEIDLIRQL
jgi:ribosomal protein S18 acetylase RimI-like enzyme